MSLSMVSGDIDRDGVDDLAVGYGTSDGGIIAIHRGNLDAFAPQSKESFEAIGRGDFPSPFLPDAKAFTVPLRPDFIAEGIFNPYGYRDVIVAARGDHSIYLLSNDGKGDFSQPKAIDVRGAITALAVGEFGKNSAFSKLLVGVSDEKGTSLRIYEGATNALGDPTTIPLSAAATDLVLNEIRGERDAFFVSNGRVVELDSSSLQLATASQKNEVVSFAVGSFIFDRNGTEQIALLQSDGSLDIFADHLFDPRVFTVAEMTASRNAGLDPQPRSAPPQQSSLKRGWKLCRTYTSGSAS